MRRHAALALATFGLVWLAAGCNHGPLEIGAVLPLTGEAQTYGEMIRKGIVLAHERINATPDYPYELKLTVVDSRSDPDRAAELLTELFDQGAFTVVGGVTSDEALKMVGVADRYDRVLLSPSASNPEFSGISRNFYRVMPSDFGEATKMATFATQTLNVHEVVVVAEEQTWAKGIQEVFKHEFERLGGEVAEVIEFPPGTSDFSGLIGRVMTLHPPAVYLTAYEGAVGGLIRELRDHDYPGTVLTTHAFATPAAISRVGAAAEGVILTQYVFEVDSEHAHIQTFVKAFREKYGEDPDLFAAQGYDAFRVLAEALKEERPSIPSDLTKGLRGIKDFPGMTGSIQFNDKGDVTKFPHVYVIAEDLALYDYNARVQEYKKKLLQRLKEIRRRARGLGEDDESQKKDDEDEHGP